MSTIGSSAHSKLYAGLLPVKASDDLVRQADLKSDRLANRQPSFRKRALSTFAYFLIAFCVILAAILAWRSYGDVAKQVLANSSSQLGWLATQQRVQKAPETIALAAPAAPYPGQQQLDAMSRDLHATRQSIDRIAAGQEEIARSVHEIATSIAAAQREMMRSSDQTATSQEQAPSAKVDIGTSEVRQPQTLSERGKQLSAAVSARSRARDHRSDAKPSKGIVGAMENGLSAPPGPYTRPPE